MRTGSHTASLIERSEKMVLFLLAGIVGAFLNCSCEGDANRLRDREVDFEWDTLTEEVRDLHCVQRIEDLEIESRQFSDAFNAWFTQMVLVAPKRENGFSLEPGVIIWGTAEMKTYPESKTLSLTGLTQIDALDRICGQYDVYFCYREGRIRISPNAQSLLPQPPVEYPEGPGPIDPFADPTESSGELPADADQ